MPSQTLEERHALWKQFLDRWTPQALADITLPQYHTANDPEQDNLVNWLEIRTESLGSVWGGSGFKFGIYNRADKSHKESKDGRSYTADYAWYTMYGASPDEAFQNVRDLIMAVVDASQKGDSDAIEHIAFSPIIKWKLAFLYQPQDKPFMPAIYAEAMLKNILSITKPLPMLEMYRELMQQRDRQDILEFTDILLKKINLEKPFAEWLAKQRQPNGKLYSSNSIPKYISRLKKSTSKIEGVEINPANLFYYTTPSAFADVHRRILAAPNFGDLNAATSGEYSASMERYKVFLKEYTEESGVPIIATESDDTPPLIAPDAYTLQSIRDEGCFLSLAALEGMFSRLHTKKNIILQGPPGTGKTWLAKRLAWALTGEKNGSRVQALQFHATLSYEDFVCGWRPVGDGKLALQDGPFLEALARANENPETPYVLVIEEINRGNPAQIFGELLTLLEADKRKPEEALRLCYKSSSDAPLHLPANLHLIGTMNIADRSLAIVDFALRRRFSFFDLTPNFGEDWQNWMHYQAGLHTAFVAALGEAMQTCNSAIAGDPSLGPQYAIGHSFVTYDRPIPDARAWIEGIVAAEITPLLKEYWFDDPQKAGETAQKILDALP